uniref:Uncharacterized protein LOC116950056 isoform X2 n=1 Tax=Petromyzon marinus TaxID=7757 RepID=A0AAJ7TUP9_PETMA|nr:uncharacterized protein LOC116950056 isoform X2 [Petromyzon marinus]
MDPPPGWDPPGWDSPPPLCVHGGVRGPATGAVSSSLVAKGKRRPRGRWWRRTVGAERWLPAILWLSMNAQWGAPQGTGVPAGPLTPGSPSEVTFQKLEFLSLQQLRGLLENEEKLAEMVQCVELERCTAVASTRSLAELNMGLEPQLALSRAVLSSKYQQLHELLRHYQRKQRQLAESFDGSCCPETLLALLQAETAKAEEEAEVSDWRSRDENTERERDEGTHSSGKMPWPRASWRASCRWTTSSRASSPDARSSTCGAPRPTSSRRCCSTSEGVNVAPQTQGADGRTDDQVRLNPSTVKRDPTWEGTSWRDPPREVPTAKPPP